MSAEKPFKGRIRDWYKRENISAKGLGYTVCGMFDGHPEFHGQYGSTSYVVKFDEKTGEFETRNSRYRVEGEPVRL